MRPFERRLQEELSQFQGPKTGQVESVRAAHAAIREAEANLLNLKSELAFKIETLNANLAVAIRNRLPKVSVGLSNGRCNVSYKSKSVSVWPDLDKNKWAVEPNDSGKMFSKNHAQYLEFTDDIDALAEAIGEFFVGQYRTLQDMDMPRSSGVAREGQAIRRRGEKPGMQQYF